MGNWLGYYYKAWSLEKPIKLLSQFESYRVKKQPLMMKHMNSLVTTF
jgi:hypothetical protein